PGRGGRTGKTRRRRNGQTWCLRHRRRHQPTARRQARRRRRLRRRQGHRRLDHAGSGRSRPDDDRHVAGKLHTRSVQGMNPRASEGMNPLLQFAGLPRFDEIKPEHVGPAIDELLAAGRAAVEAATSARPTWDEFVAPLEDANERLGRAWGQVAHLHAVMDNPALREAYNAALPKVSQYWTELGQNLRLFQKYKELARSAEVAGLSPARKKIVDNALRDFRL